MLYIVVLMFEGYQFKSEPMSLMAAQHCVRQHMLRNPTTPIATIEEKK